MEKIRFEDGIEKLEQLVSKLEKGDMPLEESFRAYEEGVALGKALKAILDEGDAKIRVLKQAEESGEKE